MENYNKVVELAKTLIVQDEELQAKPTKACRARIRSTMNEIKKAVTAAKQETLAADKA